MTQEKRLWTVEDVAMLIADFGHYMQRHAEYELAASTTANAKQKKLNIIKAEWAANEAVRVAKRLGLYPDYVQTNVLDRATTH